MIRNKKIIATCAEVRVCGRVVIIFLFPTEIPPSPHHRYNTNSVGIIHTLSRGGGRGGVTDEGLVSDYGIGHG